MAWTSSINRPWRLRYVMNELHVRRHRRRTSRCSCGLRRCPVRIAEFLATVAEMQEAIDALVARIDELESGHADMATASRPKPISRPLDVHSLAAGVFGSYAAYLEEDEEEDESDVWGHGKYL
jgi:hypothetical protein